MARMTHRERQALAREARRLFRMVEGLFPTHHMELLRAATDLFFRQCVTNPRQPAFILRDVMRVIRSTQRTLNNGGACPLDFCDNCTSHVMCGVRMQAGSFSGRLLNPLDPTSECPICLSRRGLWWCSTSCALPHFFHAQCMWRHLRNDIRCPICRTDVWFGN
jgi:hypothetical protein